VVKASCGTIRLKLLKIGEQVTVSARRVPIAYRRSIAAVRGLPRTDASPALANNSNIEGRPRPRRKDGNAMGVPVVKPARDGATNARSAKLREKGRLKQLQAVV